MVHVRRLIVLVCWFLGAGCFHVAAQDSELDSLETLLEQTNLHDTTRLGIISSILERVQVSGPVGVHYNTIIKTIVFRNLKNKHLTKAERDNYLYYQAFWYMDKASELFSVKNARVVLRYIDEAIKIFRYLKMEDLEWMAMINKGNILRKMHAWDEAMACYFDALEYNERKGNTLDVAGVYSCLGLVYDDQDKFPESISCFKKALAGYNALKNAEPQQLYEKAIILHNLGHVYYQVDDFGPAISCYHQSMKIGKEQGLSDHVAYDADKLAVICLRREQYDEALKWINEGLTYSKTDRSRNNLLCSLGKLYAAKKQYGKAVGYFQEALVLARELDDNELTGPTAMNLYNVYKTTNQPAKALEMYELYIRSKDASKAEAAENALMQQELKYAYEKKVLLNKAAQDRRLAQVSLSNEQKHARKNLLISVSALLIVLALVSLYYYFRQKTRTNAAKNNELKQKLLLTQMNPHFIFNSVDNIQSLIYNKQEKEAISYLTKFSKLTRQILEHSRENYILLSEEIAMLENYLTIQKLLYNNQFAHSIELSEDIDPDALLVPPMLTQPFIENAIRHGLKNKQEGGVVRIRYFISNSQLQFEVTDNGSGLVASENNNKSLSTQITRERLQSISAKSGIDIETANIVDADNVVHGVRTRFEIPYVYNT